MKINNISEPATAYGVADSYTQISSGTNYLDYVGGGMGITAIAGELTYRHNLAANVLFLDFHVKQKDKTAIMNNW